MSEEKKNYYVSSYSSWFIVRADNETKARTEGYEEYGFRRVKEVRLATDDEVRSFIAQKGENAIVEV